MMIRLLQVLLVIGNIFTLAVTARAEIDVKLLVGRAREHVTNDGGPKTLLGLAALEATLPTSSGTALPSSASRRGADAAALQEWLCWRTMPVGTAGLHDFGRQIDELRQHAPDSRWLPVLQLYQAHLQGDRKALLTAARRHVVPKAFPTAGAEQAVFELLVALGVPRIDAALHVLEHRRFDVLHALLDLDRGLSREADFLQSAGRKSDASVLLRRRDQLRSAYLDMSRHLVERLFALRLLGRDPERQQLIEQSRELEYLHTATALGERLNVMDQEQAWSLLLGRLLKSEVQLVSDPPQLPATQDDKPATSRLTIRANSRKQQNDAKNYTGEVNVTLGDLRIQCDTVTVDQHNAKRPGSDRQSGSRLAFEGAGNIIATGRFGKATAERVSLDADSGTITLGGRVRLRTLTTDNVVMAELLTVALDGKIQQRESLLDAFRKLEAVAAKRALLPRIHRAYDDDELPHDVQYLLALHVLAPHLSWHVGYLPVPTHGADVLNKLRDEARMWSEDPWRWKQAHAGEPWMREAVAVQLRKQWMDRLRALDKRVKVEKFADKPLDELPVFWRIKDPKHADVARAIALLERVVGTQQSAEAQHWLVELKRDNTVLTFDVLAGYPLGPDKAEQEPGEQLAKTRVLGHGEITPTNWPIVMDIRGAGEVVSLKLYRVREPQDLVAVTQRIGRDYMYQDYGLQYGRRRLSSLMDAVRMHEQLREIVRHGPSDLPALPTFEQQDLVYQWQVLVEELDRVPAWRLEHDGHERWEDWDDDGDDPDSHYFGDDSWKDRARARKDYREQWHRPTTWRTDRVVPIPGSALDKVGAYVLVAEANGQQAYVPLIVEPLSLTLRRCRDGVFALVSDAAGIEPIAGAEVMALQQFGNATTDSGGAAFLRVFAQGNRTIVAHKEGRYAIGGFGDLFEGIYNTWQDRECRSYRREFAQKRLAREEMMELSQSAQVYADQHLVAAYTDRPTYRPGQKVQFKLIVRMIHREEQKGRSATTNGGAKGADQRTFRAADFDFAAQLELPKADTAVRYEVVNPKGRTIDTGTLKLNDYGTAAGSAELNPEAAVGAYQMRVWLADRPRIVPDVFGVKYYRRPNFKLTVAGVPTEVREPQDLRLQLDGQYYFGKPVVGGTVSARLVRPDHYKPIVTADATLDDAGRAEADLHVPKHLAPGQYYVLTVLTDDSGRSVTDSRPYVVTMDKRDDRGGIIPKIEAPRFAPIGQPFQVRSSAQQIELNDTNVANTINNVATITLTRLGWNELSADGETARIYAYGGTVGPFDGEAREQRAQPAPRQERPREQWPQGVPQPDPDPRWVNLTDYEAEVDQEYRSIRPDDDEAKLLALFGSHHATIGGKLPVLVFVPSKKARVLLTLEGRTVVDYHVTNVSGEHGYYHEIELPIRERCLPNFYVQGRIIAWQDEPSEERLEVAEEPAQALKALEERMAEPGEDPHWCRIDVIDPDADKRPGQAGLRVAVETDRDEYLPGQAVNARIRVTDLHGAPRATEVSLAAVDASLFSFGEDQLDALPTLFDDMRPARRFFPKAWRSHTARQWTAAAHVEAVAQLAESLKRAEQSSEALAAKQQELASQSANLADLSQRVSIARRAHLPRRIAVPLQGEMPATSIPLARLRHDFRETATWQPQLRTAADGSLAASFKLPDSLTSYRLSAVAITKATELGVGRARVRASQPLNVQLFVPRFAVENDQLLAVGLIHNTTDAAHRCKVVWQVAGARAGACEGNDIRWRRASVDGDDTDRRKATTATGEVTVPAKGATRVGIWLVANALGKVRVTLQAAEVKRGNAERGDRRDTDAKDTDVKDANAKDADGQDVQVRIADAEQRVFSVRPTGRHREVVMTGAFRAQDGREDVDVALAGKFRATHRLTLPEGFIADDLRISIARGDIAHSLDGLQYLIDYPYGCVEQTMSRFLPAVAVKHAVTQAPVELPPQVAAKLPDVLHRGLARLYNFQHDDGGWGWWEKDASNNQMTVYVVYGLARCQATGTTVDTNVLTAGCNYLKTQLASGALRNKSGKLNHGSRSLEGGDLEARAWLALVLAGQADRAELVRYAEQADANDRLSSEARCHLALACREAGLAELGARLWRPARIWQPDTSDQLALVLSAQLAFGEPLPQCDETAYRLLQRRSGHRWENTRATAWAIESLSGMLRYAVTNGTSKRIAILVDGHLVREVHLAEDLQKMVHRVTLAGDALSRKEGQPIELSVDTDNNDESFLFTVTATGTQRLDRMEPTGTSVTMVRRATTTDGEPLGETVPVGQMIAVHLDVALAAGQNYVMIDEPRPAGCEFAADRLEAPGGFKPTHVEFRDDRMVAFFTSLPPGRHRFTYYLRAETEGRSHQLPGAIYPMYQEKQRGETGGTSIQVERHQPAP